MLNVRNARRPIMNLTKAYKEWEQDPDSMHPERKRSLPKRWKIKLQAYKNRKDKEQS